MRSWLHVQLGTWHIYKQANTVVWKHWSERIFAPLFHDLIPDANFNKKARLTTISVFLTYVRLSYPSFRDELNAALKSVTDANQRVAISHLRDLKKLCEFAIPVVGSHVIMMSFTPPRLTSGCS